MDKVLLKIGGIYHLLCAVMHVYFPYLFQWNQRLAPLSGESAGIISANLAIMNYCLLIFWVMLAYVPLFHTAELLDTKIGKTILTGIIIFWAARIFVLQPLYAGYNSAESLVTVAVFLVGLAFFAIPWVRAVLMPRAKHA